MGTKNAAKKTRKIELGWLNFDSTTNTYKQVRKPRGGGTRKLDIMKEASKEDILQRATDVFFPGGVSKLGPLKEFRFDLRDFSEDMVSPTDTLEEMCTKTAMQTLRFSLTTTRIVSDTEDLPEPASLSYSFPENVSSPVLSAVSMNLSEDIDFLLDSASNIADTQGTQISATDAVNMFETQAARISVTDSANMLRTEAADMFETQTAETSETKSANMLETEAANLFETEAVHISDTVAANIITTQDARISENRNSLIPETSDSNFTDTQSETITKTLANIIDTEVASKTPSHLPSHDVGQYETSEVISTSDPGLWHQLTSTPVDPVTSDDTETEIFFRTVINHENMDDHLSPKSDLSPVEMKIHRGPMAFMELVGYFKDATVSKRQLMIQRILPNGEKEMAEDTGGVWRDLISEFWTEFYDRCTMGRVAKVPRLRHDFGEEEWKAVARILVHGYKFASYWPLQIARTFLQHCLEPNVEVQNPDLLSDFYLYISVLDKEILQKAVDDFGSVEFDDLLETLSMHDCQTAPSTENIKAILLEISHKELIQTPMFIADCWKGVLVDLRMDGKKLNEIYQDLELSNKRVVQLLSFPDTMDVQSTAVSIHLKRYVRNLDKQILGLFMRFCTGADLPIVNKISVEFTSMGGLQRRPVAHTCSCMLQISKFYESFMDFRTEFDNVLKANIWVMDFV